MAIVNGINGIQNLYDRGVNDNNTSTGKGNEFDPSKLSSGQTISGKLVGLNGDSATIDIGGATINARLEGSMNLKEGDTVTFTLRSNNGSQVTLSPLFTNLGQQEMASKALTAAGLSISDQTLSLTSKMMNAGIGIDSKNLSDMYHLANAHPDTDISMLAEMRRFGLDINDDTIGRFSAFKNFENQISSDMDNIMNGINKVYSDMISGGNEAEGAQFLSNVIKTFSNVTDPSGAMAANLIPGQENAATMSVGADVQGLGEQGVSLLNEKLIISEEKMLFNEQILNTTTAENMENAKQQTVQDAESFEAIVKLPNQEAEKVNIDLSSKLNDAWQTLNNTDRSMMVDVLKQSGLGENEAKFLMSDGATQQDFLQFTEQLISKGDMSDAIKDMVQSDRFGNILKSQMQAQWLLSPIDVENKETVESLYQRLSEQTKEISNTLAEMTLSHSELSQDLSNMNQNLDFMQQMNQAMQYIQLPLQMSGSEATGDLYVYTNKRKLAENDGNVSAMLHLDMANLGPVDVYASITPGNNVYTKFYLANDEMIDFIEDNIHILNERLEKRGYNMKTEMVLAEDSKKRDTFPELKTVPANTDDGRLIAKYSFNCLV